MFSLLGTAFDITVYYFMWLGGITLGLNATALLIYSLIFRRWTAYVVTLLSFCFLDVGQHIIEGFIKPWFGYDDYVQLVRFAWYMSFAITNIIVIGFISFVVEKKQLFRDVSSTWIIYFYVLMTCLQMSDYAFRLILNSNALENIYSYGVVSANIIVSVLAWVHVVRAIRVIYLTKLQKLIGG